jgi:hypothetical protein
MDGRQAAAAGSKLVFGVALLLVGAWLAPTVNEPDARKIVGNLGLLLVVVGVGLWIASKTLPTKTTTAPRRQYAQLRFIGSAEQRREEPVDGKGLSIKSSTWIVDLDVENRTERKCALEFLFYCTRGPLRTQAVGLAWERRTLSGTGASHSEVWPVVVPANDVVPLRVYFREVVRAVGGGIDEAKPTDLEVHVTDRLSRRTTQSAVPGVAVLEVTEPGARPETL